MIPGGLKSKKGKKQVVRRAIVRPKKAPKVKVLGDGVKKAGYGKPWKIKY